jgi:hypothetical protein
MMKTNGFARFLLLIMGCAVLVVSSCAQQGVTDSAPLLVATTSDIPEDTMTGVLEGPLESLSGCAAVEGILLVLPANLADASFRIGQPIRVVGGGITVPSPSISIPSECALAEVREAFLVSAYTLAMN